MIRLPVVLAVLLAAATAEVPVELDGAKGHIHKVDLGRRSFELLKETEYDPKSDIGQSRFTIHWDEGTRLVRTRELDDFTAIEGPVMAVFRGIREPDLKALREGRAFEARVVTLHREPGFQPPAKEDANEVAGMFTPVPGMLRGGVLRLGGKPIEVRLRPKYWRIWLRDGLTPEGLAEGHWKATLHGKMRDGRFLAGDIEVSELPDPRKTDDPSLPRILVIGDSISMNYHEAAKAALKGVANYHRCEGNAFTSGHGVRNAELWMGEHAEPGCHWDVIQFNHGLHDLKQGYDAETGEFGPYAVPLDAYKANLRKLIGLLRASGARLIWCTTTPVPNDNTGTYARRKGAPAEFNAAALEVMKEHPDILINDLHGLVESSPVFDEWRKTRDVHFYREEEQQALGEAVARAVRQALDGKP